MGLNKPEEVWDEQFNKLFAKKPVTDTEQILNIVSLIIYGDKNDDMGRLYARVGLNNFSEIIDVFGGRVVSFMEKENLKNNLLLAICYYYREFKGYSWEKVQSILPFQVNAVSMGIRIANLNSNIKKQIDELFFEMEESDGKK